MEDGIFFFVRQLFISNVKKSILNVKNLLHPVGLFIKCKYSSLNKSINLAYYYCHIANILATPVRYGPNNPPTLAKSLFLLESDNTLKVRGSNPLPQPKLSNWRFVSTPEEIAVSSSHGKLFS